MSDDRMTGLVERIVACVDEAMRTGNWDVVDAVRKLIEEEAADPRIRPLLDRLDVEVESARIQRALPKLMELARKSGDDELVGDVLVLARAVLLRVQLGTRMKRRDRGLKRQQRKITAEAYAEAWGRSRTGSVADVARRMKVSRQNLSDWLKQNPSQKRATKK